MLTDRYGRVIVYRAFAIFSSSAPPGLVGAEPGEIVSTIIAISIALAVGVWGCSAPKRAAGIVPRHRYIGVSVAREASAVLAGGSRRSSALPSSAGRRAIWDRRVRLDAIAAYLSLLA
jgi:MHS family metabolite:H+ symporter-like MFS transporter